MVRVGARLETLAECDRSLAFEIARHKSGVGLCMTETRKRSHHLIRRYDTPSLQEEPGKMHNQKRQVLIIILITQQPRFSKNSVSLATRPL